MHFRFKPRRNPGSQSQNRSVNRTAVVGDKVSYLRRHIPGAVHSSYGGDGWRGKDRNGTLGQFPGGEKLEKLIGRLGIDNATHVVIVPTGARAADVGVATRIYWTFKVLGHDAVSILNGGMTAYWGEVDKKGEPANPLKRGREKPQAKTFMASLSRDMLVTKEEVKKALDAGILLVDNRPANQYLGVNKSGIVKRYGTIPGAKNVPENWMTVDGGGVFRDKATLARLYAAAGVSTSAVQFSFCNTGHWASLGWFVSSELLGNTEARMYDGSMLEWAADESMPVEVKVKS